ncbi:MAG TPA: DUF4080 domain-containing protein [Firmicutes bacterium]|nr:DUF4080 domain-containing protein [Bacillota bacterium]
MKIVLTTLNAKYTHHNLALRYLRAYCGPAFPGLIVKEYNINQQLALVLSELVDENPDVMGFSCYIWNIEQTLVLISDLKKVLPNVKVILGGPEVSYDAENLMDKHLQIDYIVIGEGEEPLLKLLQALENGGEPTLDQLRQIPSLVYRSDGQIHTNPQMTMDLSRLPSPYQDHFDELEHKIVYFETSRGCPFRCQYCLSSRTGKVRYFPMEQVKADLQRLARLGIDQIRFVDRTFNCHPQRALELIKFICELETTTRFQLEIGGDLIAEEMIQLLEQAPANRFQFEIGVQSTNPITLEEIGRTTNLDKLAANCRKLRERTQVRFLLDLIAGLPQESYDRFGDSFNFVYNLEPTKIQLGFLKLLKGSRLRDRANDFGCLFTERAPYEVLQTTSISYSELAFLNVIEGLVESYYNSGRFKSSLDYLIVRDFGNPFSFFEHLAQKWKTRSLHLVSHSLVGLYRLLWELVGDQDPVAMSYLRFDFRSHERKQATPRWMQGEPANELKRQLIQDGTIFRYLSHLKPLQLTPRELSKRFAVELFEFKIYPWQAKPVKQRQFLIFDYSESDQVRIYDATQ